MARATTMKEEHPRYHRHRLLDSGSHINAGNERRRANASKSAARLPCSTPDRRRPSFEYLIGSQDERRGNRQAYGLGRPVVDHQLERCWLLDRKVTWFRALQDLVHVSGGTPSQIREVWTVRHEAPSLDVYPSRMYRGQPARGHRVDEARTVRHEEWGIGVQHTLDTA